MTGKEHRYPILRGSATLTLSGKKFSVVFEDRSITIEGNDKDLEFTVSKLSAKTPKLGEIRNIARIISALGITFHLRDSKGIVLTIGKAVWTPLGHFSFRPRLRKYLKGS